MSYEKIYLSSAIGPIMEKNDTVEYDEKQLRAVICILDIREILELSELTYTGLLRFMKDISSPLTNYNEKDKERLVKLIFLYNQILFTCQTELIERYKLEIVPEKKGSKKL